MTLTDRIAKIKQEAAAIMAGNPEIDSIWYEFKDVPLDELEAYPLDDAANSLRYNEKLGMMQLQVNIWNPRLVIFAYSKKVRVVKPEVMEVEA